MIRRKRLAAASFAVLVVLTACGGSGAERSDDTTTTSTGGAAEDRTGQTTTEGSGTEVPSSIAEPPSAASPEPHPSLDGTPAFAELGEPTIALLNDIDGNGPRPLLRWSAVDGATIYRVMIVAPDGEPYWAWEGSGTEVAFGGPVPLDDASAGPQLSEGMRWYVVAGAGDGGLPLGQSAIMTIDP